MKKNLVIAWSILGLIAFSAGSVIPNHRNHNPPEYMAAVEQKDFESIHFFVNNGANVDIQNHDGLTPLMIAIQENNIDSIRFLLNHGADVNIHANDDTTPLIFAVGFRNFEAVKLLVDHGALIDVRTYYDMTAITLARSREYWDILDYLLKERENQRHSIIHRYNSVTTGENIY